MKWPLCMGIYGHSEGLTSITHVQINLFYHVHYSGADALFLCNTPIILAQISLLWGPIDLESISCWEQYLLLVGLFSCTILSFKVQIILLSGPGFLYWGADALIIWCANLFCRLLLGWQLVLFGCAIFSESILYWCAYSFWKVTPKALYSSLFAPRIGP